MRFEERYESGKEHRIARSPAKLVRPNSGHIYETLSPPRLSKR